MQKEAFEPTGLIPRSIIRTFDRFLQQLLPGTESIAIQEYRVSRYQILVSIKSFLSLICIPIFINYTAKVFLLTPLTEYLWNAHQGEIFLNAYQEKRAFAEMHDFSEKLFFESLVKDQVVPSNALAPDQSLTNPVGLIRDCFAAVCKHKDIKSNNSNWAVDTSPFGSPNQNQAFTKPYLNHFFTQYRSSVVSPSISGQAVNTYSYGLGDVATGINQCESNQVLPDSRGLNGADRSTPQIGLCKHCPDFFDQSLNICNYNSSYRLALKKVALDQSLTNPVGLVRDCFGAEWGRPECAFTRSISDSSINEKTVISAFPLKVTSSATLTTAYLTNPLSKEGIGVNSAGIEGLPVTYLYDDQVFGGKKAEEEFFYNKYNAFEEKIKLQKQFQLQSLEIATAYNKQSILAITNLLGDFITFFTIYLLFVIMKPQIIILKSFLTESIYSLSDTTKSFLLILVMDLLVGFHSPRGWEIALEALLRHFGLPENENFILLFVALFPVFLDTVFKYWIFRYLNKISPSTVVTYHSMLE